MLIDFCRFLLDSFDAVLVYRFTIDCPSHVRLHLWFRATQFSESGAHFIAISIAIWNKNKAIMILAVTVSATSIAFHLHSESLRLNSAEYLKSFIMNVDWQQISHW